ncbi:MAG: T9SS type A sorting domain-containing protein [Brumimicrobium sp.]
MKKTLLLLALSVVLSGFSQTTVYSEDFETGNSFTMNSSDLGAAYTNSTWLVNNSYTGGSGTLVCVGFPFSFTIGNTPTQPAGISGSPSSNYMHITAQDAISNGITNASYVSADGICFFDETNFTKMTAPISTTGLAGIAFDFWYLCGGSADAFGEVYYSLDGGSTWTLKQSTFNNTTAWTQLSLTDAAWDNQASILFGFRFVNNTASTAADPGFSVDQILITSNSVACAETTSSITETACDSYTSPSGNYTWTSTNTYMDTIPNAAGCDSVITIDLTINTVDPSISQAGVVLTANESGATYAWLNCSDMTLVSGETGQSFTATANGDYAAIVTAGNCVDTSACATVNTVGIEENQSTNLISIYPNPNNGLFNLELGNDAQVQIIDLTGKSILNQNYAVGNHKIDLSSYSDGVYLLKVLGDGVISNAKIVKK